MTTDTTTSSRSLLSPGEAAAVTASSTSPSAASSPGETDHVVKILIFPVDIAVAAAAAAVSVYNFFEGPLQKLSSFGTYFLLHESLVLYF